MHQSHAYCRLQHADHRLVQTKVWLNVKPAVKKRVAQVKKLTPIDCWWGKLNLKKSCRPDKKRRDCQSGKRISSTSSRWMTRKMPSPRASPGQVLLSYKAPHQARWKCCHDLRLLLATTKAINKLIPELLFAEDRAPLAHTEEVLQAVVGHFAKAALSLDQTTNSKRSFIKTLYTQCKAHLDHHQLPPTQLDEAVYILR